MSDAHTEWGQAPDEAAAALGPPPLPDADAAEPLEPPAPLEPAEDAAGPPDRPHGEAEAPQTFGTPAAQAPAGLASEATSPPPPDAGPPGTPDQSASLESAGGAAEPPGFLPTDTGAPSPRAPHGEAEAQPVPGSPVAQAPAGAATEPPQAEADALRPPNPTAAQAPTGAADGPVGPPPPPPVPPAQLPDTGPALAPPRSMGADVADPAGRVHPDETDAGLRTTAAFTPAAPAMGAPAVAPNGPLGVAVPPSEPAAGQPTAGGHSPLSSSAAGPAPFGPPAAGQSTPAGQPAFNPPSTAAPSRQPGRPGPTGQSRAAPARKGRRGRSGAAATASGTAPQAKRTGRSPRWWLWPVGTAVVVAGLGVGGYVAATWAVDRAATQAAEDIRATLTPQAQAAVEERTGVVRADMEILTSLGPKAQGEQYLSLLASGKAAEALALVGAEPGATTSTEFYGTLQSRMSSPYITEVTPTDGGVTMTYTFRVGDWEGTDSLYADRQGRFEWALGGTPTQPVSVGSSWPGTVSVEGMDVTGSLQEGEGGSRTAEVALLPGQYTVSYSDPAGRLTADPVSVTVTPDLDSNGRYAITKPHLREDLMAAVQAEAEAQVRAWTDQCKASNLRGATCGEEVREEGDYLVGKAWTGITIDEYPTAELSGTDSPFIFRLGSTGATYHTSGWSTESSEGVVDRYRVSDWYSGTVTYNDDGSITVTQEFS